MLEQAHQDLDGNENFLKTEIENMSKNKSKIMQKSIVIFSNVECWKTSSIMNLALMIVSKFVH